MVEALVPYGGVIYWLLLFLGIYLVTMSAVGQNDPFRPTMWTLATAIFAFGFTSYSPNITTVFMAFFCHIMLGVVYAAWRWSKITLGIKRFARSLGDENKVPSALFLPNDAEGDYLITPPDPYEFRTRILMWILFWPCFTLFAFIEKLHRFVSTAIWKMFRKISKDLYED